MGRNFGKGMGMGRGRGRGRCRERGKNMAQRGMMRRGGSERYPLTAPSDFEYPTAESMPPDQELAMLKEQARSAETQINAIDAQIKILKEGSETSTLTAIVNPDKCIGCQRCFYVCPTEAIFMDEETAEIDRSKCTGCGRCIPECPEDAIVMKNI
jgi:ferredoxin